MEEEKLKRATIRYLLTLLLILVATTMVDAQSSAGKLLFNEIEGNDTPLVQDSNFPQLRLDVTPINTFSFPIQNLRADQFVVLENDQPVENVVFEAVTETNIPVSVVLLLDTNRSMRTDLAEVKASALSILDLLSEADETAVISMGSDGESSNFSSDAATQTNFINGLTVDPDARRPLYDGIGQALELSQSAQNERKVIILLTDGEDESSSREASEILAEASETGTAVFTVGLGSNVDAPFLESLATSTGGRYRNVARGSEFVNLATLAITQLKQVYRLSYQTAVVSNNELNRLMVNVDTGSEQLSNSTDFRARYPIIPQIQQIDVRLANGETVSIDDLSEIQGIVQLIPRFIARNEIARVDYFVGENPNPIFSASQPPYSFQWDTNNLPSNVLNTLRIQVIDNAAEENLGQYERYILVGECGLLCRYQQTGDLMLFFIIGGGVLVVLLLIGGYIALNRNRRNKLAEIEEYTAPPAWFERVEAFPVSEPMRVKPASRASNKNNQKKEKPIDSGSIKRPKPAVAKAKNGQAAPSGNDFHGAVRQPAPPVRKRPARPPLRHQTIRKQASAPNGTMPLKNIPARDRTEMLPKYRNRLLAYLKDEETQREYILYGNTTIGRAADNKIVLEDASVSSYHAQVKLKHGDYIISDLKATNPTQVNDQVITNYTLKNGDLIEIGRKLLTFKIVE